MTGRGEILLVACYGLGHQPLSVAWPVAFLERAGYRPAVMDLSVEPFDAEKVRRARLVAVAVPMHTALRVGVAAASRVRAANPAAHVCFYGHYAALNAEHLLGERHADSVLAGELEDALVALARWRGRCTRNSPRSRSISPPRSSTSLRSASISRSWPRSARCSWSRRRSRSTTRCWRFSTRDTRGRISRRRWPLRVPP